MGQLHLRGAKKTTSTNKQLQRPIIRCNFNKYIVMTEVLAHCINANTPKRLVTNRSTHNCSNNPDQVSTESRTSQHQSSSYSTEMKRYLYSLFLRKKTNIAHTFPLFHNSIALHCLLISSFLDVHKNGA